MAAISSKEGFITHYVQFSDVQYRLRLGIREVKLILDLWDFFLSAGGKDKGVTHSKCFLSSCL